MKRNDEKNAVKIMLSKNTNEKFGSSPAIVTAVCRPLKSCLEMPHGDLKNLSTNA